MPVHQAPYDTERDKRDCTESDPFELCREHGRPLATELQRLLRQRLVFYSPDCSEIVWRAGRPEGAALDEYRSLLAEGLTRPKNVEIPIAKADGSEPKRLTNNGAANFCPYFTPDSKRVIFASNATAGGREFDLYLVSRDGGPLERVTTAPGFDGFPFFSPDGKWIVWASNRADPGARDTNLFLARWKP